MTSLDDSSLDQAFEELCALLGEADRLNPAHGDPLLYLVFRPEQALTVKRKLPGWMTRLSQRGFNPVRVSLADIVREIIDDSGRWPEWLEQEPSLEQSEHDRLNEAVRSLLRQDDNLVNRVAARIAEGDDRTVVLLTECELLHPYYRVRAIESRLVGRVVHPTVILYPGRRVGQYNLHFLGFYPEDGNYRSTLVGGLE